ncbi:hypothetical protein [Propionimicrobium sp. PCR01-08-3]|uniref:hypothetical protein n=1 Tax=Propionimicrobium sp. PCR01-08-3 TaxID=3052086 RepID=UPI00255C7E54|nr:hypothetical protein [Propionimicrobium sp. PCR01-08-3]WIY81921.1 hypothetical protein QQ658_10400 [Propionimicrobium sp. PCR01-08-3]
MTDSVPVEAIDCDRTARSVTARILRGAGNASLLAYRCSPMVSCEAMVHGISRSGRLVVAACPDSADPVAEMEPGQSYAIRMDITKESPEPGFRLVAATVHLLGELEWQPDWATDELIDAGELPCDVAAIASAPGGRLGVITTDRCLIHDAAGVRSFAFDELIQADGSPAFPLPADELDAHHLVMALSNDSLRGIRDSVLKGTIEGRLCSRQSLLAGCPHTWDQVLCADVDCTGITMLTVEPTETYSVFAAFDREVGCLDELNDQVQRLVSATLVTTPGWENF